MLTVCVPTKNRPEFLARLLRYYQATAFQQEIFVGDASDPNHAVRNQRIIQAFHGTLTIRYFEHPGLNVIECLERLSEAASTPYCSWVSDDDFLCPTGIDQCLAFLEAHPAYVAAQGFGILFHLHHSGPYGAIAGLGRYPHAIVEAETASQRLWEHFAKGRGPYSLHTAVRRIQAFRDMVGGYGHVRGVRQGFIFDDLMAHGLAAIQGKVKNLDCVYLIRQAHDGIYRQVNGYDWITHPDWLPSYQVFHDRVVQGLVHKDGISVEEAHEVLKRTFWPCLTYMLVSSWRKYEASIQWQAPARLRNLVKRIPGARQSIRWLRSMVQRWRDELSLPALLSRSSHYHEDFMPIYRVVTNPPAEVNSDGTGTFEPRAATASV